MFLFLLFGPGKWQYRLLCHTFISCLTTDVGGYQGSWGSKGWYWELFGASFLPIPIPSSFLPIPSVADAVVVVVGSWGSCWVKCANHQSPPARAICRGEHRRPSKLIRRRAEAATGKQQLMSFQSMGLLMPLQFLLFFVVDAFWYRRIKIESDRSITYNIIQLRVDTFQPLYQSTHLKRCVATLNASWQSSSRKPSFASASLLMFSWVLEVVWSCCKSMVSNCL